MIVPEERLGAGISSVGSMGVLGIELVSRPIGEEVGFETSILDKWSRIGKGSSVAIGLGIGTNVLDGVVGNRMSMSTNCGRAMFEKNIKLVIWKGNLMVFQKTQGNLMERENCIMKNHIPSD